MQVRIGLVGAHDAFVHSVATTLDTVPAFTVVGTARTPQAFLSSAERCDIILLDLGLPGPLRPEENIRILRAARCPIIGGADGGNLDDVRSASRAGIEGIGRMSATLPEIVSLINVVLRGELEVIAEWALAIDDDRSFVEARLGQREKEVLYLAASGASPLVIATQLFVDQDDVSALLRQIVDKYADGDDERPSDAAGSPDEEQIGERHRDR